MQTVDFGDSGPIRCSSCKAYMNPHMQFLDRGRKFKCCFCGSLTPTPVDYVCNTGVDGRRHDANDRAELCRGSVDFIASQEYMVSHQHIFFEFVWVPQAACPGVLKVSTILCVMTMSSACISMQYHSGSLPVAVMLLQLCLVSKVCNHMVPSVVSSC